MSVEQLATYVAMDRRHALARGTELPDRTNASVLLADISGFTPMTEALVEALGPRRGAEELTEILNRVYTSLVSRVHAHGGSVVCFIGDALIAVFDGDSGAHAVACTLEMQEAMEAFESVSLPGGSDLPLAMKAAVETGGIRRFLVGDPALRRIDVLAGATVERLTDAEHEAESGDVLVGPGVLERLGPTLSTSEMRGPFGVVDRLLEGPKPRPWPTLETTRTTPDDLRPLVLPEVFERVVGGQGGFLAELRPIAALFLRFEGIDYDTEDDAGEKLQALTSWVQSIVHRYGGHVLLLTTADKGSHLYAAFGALEAHEDDAERAVAAALALREPPAELDFARALRIGVSQGRVRVGGYGGEARRTYGALGETVNLAARLMGAAPEGEIRCSEAIYAASRARVAFEELPEVALKGMRRAQAVFRPIALLEAREASDRGRLVGRAEEVAILRQSLEEARAGLRQLVLLEGEAGIGKSRLIDELHTMAERAGAAWFLGAASSIEQSTPYRAWRPVVASLLDLDGAADTEERRAGVIEGIVDLDPAYRDRAPLLNDVLGLDLPETNLTRSYDPQLRREGLASLVGEFLRRRSDSAPLVLVLDDVQWLDSLSWDLALSVARTLVDRPALLLLAHRPLGEPSPGAYRTMLEWQTTERLALGSLPPGDTAALAASRLGLGAGELPREVGDLLNERAEGNPFYALEIVGALRDRGLLQIEKGVCSIGGDAAALRESVPDTLEGVVLSRIDRLPAEGQLSIKVASVIGRSFLFRTLHDVHPSRLSSGALRAQLDETDRRQLTMLEAEDPERSYAFHHAVTQQVAYDTLLFEQRRGLHRDVAEWVEKACAGELTPHVPLLAFHWRRADDASRELSYCRLAGEQAAAQYANEEALAYLDRSAELIESLGGASEQRFDVLRSRAGVLAVLGRVEEERTDLEMLRGLAEAAGPEELRGVDLLWADFHRRGGRFDEAVEEAERGLERSKASGDRLGQARALTAIGGALEGLGRFADARTRVEEALVLFRELEALDGQAASLKTLGIVSARLGEFPVAMERFGESHELFRQLGDRKGEAEILGNLGAISYYLGEYETCIENTKGAERAFREMGNRIGLAKCLTNLGNSYGELCAFADGVAQHEQALELYRQLEDANGEADSLFNIGRGLQALAVGGYPNLSFEASKDSPGLQAAIGRFDEALDIYSRIGSQRGKVLANFRLGTAHLNTGDSAEAEHFLQVALDLSREIGLGSLAMQCMAALARMSLAADDVDEALRHSTKMMEQLGDEMPPDANELHFSHFRVLMAAGREPDALPHLELAHRAVIEHAEGIRNEELRRGFLDACRGILVARDEHAPPESA